MSSYFRSVSKRNTNFRVVHSNSKSNACILYYNFEILDVLEVLFYFNNLIAFDNLENKRFIFHII